METFKLLLVEDDEREIETFNKTKERYCAQHGKSIDFVTVKNLEESMSKLDNSFDGAIVDITLNGDDNAGNELLNKIAVDFRIPVAVYTAKPENVNTELKNLEKFRRGVGYDKPLDFLYEIYNTGLTKILGGRGDIEQKINRIFWDNVLPNLNAWKMHNTNGKDTQKALLRYIVNHISELIDEDIEEYFPEEMYISPIISKTIRTGTILKRKDKDEYYIVLSPACDLAVHNGNIKTDRIMVCFIEKIEMNIVRTLRAAIETKILETEDEQNRRDKIEKIDRANIALEQLKRNNYSTYFHYLPKTILYNGGFVNFRKIETFLPSEFKTTFDTPLAQISAAFTKDIVARFSSYYARQGQPNFDDHVL